MARPHATTAKQPPVGLASFTDALRELFSPARKSVHIPRAWADERGTDVHRCQVDVLGGFPGCLKAQHRLRGAALAITDRYLIAAEGTVHGFALPLERIRAAGLLPQPGVQPPLLMVWYQDADIVGSFGLRFRGTTRTLHGTSRAEDAQAVFERLGIDVFDDASYTPPVYLPWEDADIIANDEVLWRGDATASCAGPVGSQLDSADVWLTERCLVWVPRHGTGLNHVPIDSMVSCRTGHADRLTIGIEDTFGARYDLYFDFGSRTNRDQPAAQVQNLLAAAGVPVGVNGAPLAPWRSGGTKRPGDL